MNHRVWLYRDGLPGVFGDGKAQILAAIADTGSLNLAAIRLGMSYRKAWADLRKAETCLGVPLVERSRGGPGGGGTILTPTAQRLLAAWQAFAADLDTYLFTHLARLQQEIRP